MTVLANVVTTVGVIVVYIVLFPFVLIIPLLQPLLPHMLMRCVFFVSSLRRCSDFAYSYVHQGYLMILVLLWLSLWLPSQNVAVPLFSLLELHGGTSATPAALLSISGSKPSTMAWWQHGWASHG